MIDCTVQALVNGTNTSTWTNFGTLGAQLLKISDFGVAEELDKYSNNDICYQSTGTPRFQAPEIAAGLNSFKGTFSKFESEIFIKNPKTFDFCQL